MIEHTATAVLIDPSFYCTSQHIDNRLSIFLCVKMKRTPAGDAFTEIVTRALLLSALLEQAGEAMVAPDGQSTARWKVLGVISKQKMTVSEIARALYLSRQGIQKIVDALTGDGLARYLENPTDRRANLVDLTSKGRDVLSSIRIRQIRWANHMGVKFSAKDIREIKASLEKLTTEMQWEDR